MKHHTWCLASCCASHLVSPWHKVCPSSSLWHRSYHIRLPTLFVSCQPNVFITEYHTLEAILFIRCVQEDDHHLLLSHCYSHSYPERDLMGRKQSNLAATKNSVMKAALEYSQERDSVCDCRDLTIWKIFRLQGSICLETKAFFSYWILGWRDTVIWNVIVSLANVKDLKKAKRVFDLPLVNTASKDLRHLVHSNLKQIKCWRGMMVELWNMNHEVVEFQNFTAEEMRLHCCLDSDHRPRSTSSGWTCCSWLLLPGEGPAFP